MKQKTKAPVAWSDIAKPEPDRILLIPHHLRGEQEEACFHLVPVPGERQL